MGDNIYAKQRKRIEAEIKRGELDKRQAEHARKVAQAAKEARDIMKGRGK